MKPILIPCRVGAQASEMSRGHMANVILMLRALGVPYVVTETNRAIALDDSVYSGAIVPIGYDYSNYRPWANGEKPYPVLIAHTQGIAANSATWKSGASDRYPNHDSTGSAAFTSLSGAADICMGDTTGDNRWHAWTIDTVTAPVCVPVLTVDAIGSQHTGWAPGADAAGKCSLWYRDWSTVAPGTGGKVIWNAGLSMFGLLYFLKTIGAEVPYPFRLCIDIDDIDMLHAAGAPADAPDGVEPFVAALSGRNAVALLGWNAGRIAFVPPATLTLLRAGYDAGVFRNIIHHHIGGITGENYFAEDAAPYNTVALKLAAYDADIAAWEAVGIPIERAGYHGYKYMPMNQCSRLGRRAMASAGVKRLRWAPQTRRPRSFRGVTEWLVDVGEDTLRLDWGVGNFSALSYAHYSWADTLAAYAPTTGFEQEYIARYQGDQDSGIYRVITQGVYHMMNHGLNTAANSAAPGDDMILIQWMEKVFDPLVALGGTDVIRYASDADWADIVERE